MKRKIFSKLLMVALVIAAVSSFVSCKDYDDDINNLQKQIDAKAAITQIETLQSQLASAQSAAQAAATAAENALKEAQSKTTDAAVKTAIDAAIEKVNKAAEEAATKNAEAIQKAADAAAAAKDDAAKAQEAADAAKEAAQKAYDDALAAIKAEIAKISIPDVSGFLTEAQVKALISQNAQAKGEYVTATSLATQLEDLKKTIPGAVDLTEINNAIASYNGAISALYSAITSVSLISSGNWTLQEGWLDHGSNSNNNIEFIQVQEKENKFPTDAKKAEADNQYTFTDGKYITYTDDVIVRVSPSTAVLSADMIELINSKGEAISSDLISVNKVEPYTTLLTRAAGNNGLWKVTFKLADGYAKDDFDAVKEVKVNNVARRILYAVAVNNTKDAAADRRVVSEYDVTVNTAAAVHAWDFTVNETSVANLHNRFSLSEVGTATNTIQELVWKKDVTSATGYAEKTTPIVSDPAAATDNASNRGVNAWGQFYTATQRDNRQAEPFLYVDVDENIVIEYPETNAAGDPTPLKGFYVTLDRAFAVESAPSEINAWDSYEYEGVGKLGVAATMFDGNTGTIKIKSASAKNDYIGFRVYAVNLDGTLVDPDGRAFYVYVGKESSNAQSVSANVYATTTTPTSEAAATVTFTIDPATVSETIEYGAWEIVNKASDFPYGAKPNITGVTYLDANGNAVVPANAIGLPGTTTAGKFTKAEADAIKSIKFTFGNIAQVWDDQIVIFRTKATKKVTVGTATTDLPAGSITANIKKVLPGFPAGITAKVGQFTGGSTADQFENGNYNSFLLSEIGETWTNNKHTAGSLGTKNLAQVFNIKDAELAALNLNPAKLSFEFGTSAWNAATNSFSNKVTVIHDAADTYTLSVDKALIGTVDHASKAIYEYTSVRSYKDENNVAQLAKNHTPSKAFTTAYKCLWDSPTMSWKWVDANKKAKYQKPTDTAAKDYKNLFYNTAADINLSAITGQNTYNPTLYAVKLDGLTGKFLPNDVDGTGNTYIRTAKVISKKSGYEDYYTAAFDNVANPTKVTLTPKSGTTNPEASESPVACQLILTFYDRFGHKQDITLDIDMDRQ